MRKNVFLIPMLVLCLMLSACSVGEKSQVNGEGGQVLNLAETSEPPSLDSSKSHDLVSFKVLKDVMEGLLRKGEDNTLVLGMASAFPTISTDKKTYTVKLRHALWSDGKPVTAHDFEYAWKRVLNPKTASEYSYMLFPIAHAEEYNLGKGSAGDVGVKALDDTTLQIRLKAPTPYFLDLLVFPTYFPERQDIVEKYGDQYAMETSNMVYNGPFVLSEWNHQEGFQYQRNEMYWDKKSVKLQTVNHVIVKDNATCLNLYNTGKIDMVPDLSAEFMSAYQKSPEKTVIHESYTTYLETNSRRPFFRNPHIRQALSMAINKKTFTEDVLKNGSVPAGGVVSLGIKGTQGRSFREMDPLMPLYDPLKAKQLWAQGLKELGLAHAKPIELVGDDSSISRRNLEFIADQLRKSLGASVIITSIPFKQKLERGKQGQFDLIYLGWDADYNDPMTFLDLFVTAGPLNRGKWSNTMYDSLIEKAKENPNFDVRLTDLITAEKLLIHESPIIPLCYRSRVGLLKQYVKGIVWYSIGPESVKWAYIKGKS